MGLEVNKVKYSKNWRLIRLKEQCTKITDGTHFTPEYVSSGIAFISVKDIYDDKVNFEKCKYISETTHLELIKRCNPEKDDLLITKSGTIGRMALVPDCPPFSLFVSVALIKNKKELIDSKFLKYCLENFLHHINIAQDIKGGLLKNFHLEDIRETVIPEVPLSEQRDIVSKIEELFSALDNGKQQLETAQQQLKGYRQSLLKAAFEGKLTNKNVKEGELPKGWKWVKLKEIASDISDGDHQAPPKSEKGIPFITISNINKTTSKIDFADTFKVNNDYYKNLKVNRRPQKGDVLYTVTGSFGIPILIDYEKQFCFQRHIGLVRPLSDISQRWVYYLLQSPQVFNQAKETATGTAQKTVALSSLRNFNIPFCSLKEQQLIVLELESKLTVCDKIEETITQALQQAKTLRQSILKKAFEGKLVNTEIVESNLQSA